MKAVANLVLVLMCLASACFATGDCAATLDDLYVAEHWGERLPESVSRCWAAVLSNSSCVGVLKARILQSPSSDSALFYLDVLWRFGKREAEQALVDLGRSLLPDPRVPDATVAVLIEKLGQSGLSAAKFLEANEPSLLSGRQESEFLQSAFLAARKQSLANARDHAQCVSLLYSALADEKYAARMAEIAFVADIIREKSPVGRVYASHPASRLGNTMGSAVEVGEVTVRLLSDASVSAGHLLVTADVKAEGCSLMFSIPPNELNVLHSVLTALELQGQPLNDK